MPAMEVKTILKQKNQTRRTGNIELCGPHTTLRVRKCGSGAVQVCFCNSAACTVSTVGVDVSTSLYAVICFTAAGQSMNGHLIVIR